MLAPQMNKLSTDAPVLRRQLFRAYRTWLTGMGVYRPARILHRKKRTDFYQKWDFRFCDRQTPELASLLMHEVPVAMAAALGRACRDRRININVRMILAKDYLVYRRFAEWSAEAIKKHDRDVKKTRNKRLRIAKMKKPGLPRLRGRKKQVE
jgi:hypothetical protein